MTDLTNEKCEPCSKGTPPLKGQDLRQLLEDLGEGWKVIDEHHLEREFSFENFREALAFVVKVGALAEGEGHHPDLSFGWGEAKVTLWTHKIDGLSKNDFILAAKINNEV